MVRSRFALVVVGFFALTLLGCGGGGGGGTSGPVFDGNKEAAEVDSTNLAKFAEGVTDGTYLVGDLAEGMFFSFLPPVTTTALARTSSAANAPDMVPVHYEGSCGGTFDMVYVVDQSATQITVTATTTAVDYCDDGSMMPTFGYVEDGVMVVRISETLESGLDMSITMTDWLETERATGDSNLMNGWASVDLPLSRDDESRVEMNMVVDVLEGDENEQWWLRDFVLTGGPDNIWMLTGKVYYGDEGYVWLETDTPLDLEGVGGGVVIMNGATTKGRLSYYMSSRMVELWDGAVWGDAQCFNEDWEAIFCK